MFLPWLGLPERFVCHVQNVLRIDRECCAPFLLYVEINVPKIPTRENNLDFPLRNDFILLHKVAGAYFLISMKMCTQEGLLWSTFTFKVLKIQSRTSFRVHLCF